MKKLILFVVALFGITFAPEVLADTHSDHEHNDTNIIIPGNPIPIIERRIKHGDYAYVCLNGCSYVYSTARTAQSHANNYGHRLRYEKWYGQRYV
ncbi:hypothetical protein [Vagococcus fluvialis]|uniref:C2H2-type domain-containing protein n=1 Tax=Vagococcus fluvialis TaxID=2738 RepID=A0A7X6DA23_9ENTE|nr:hypothetical protein [Vagococcus fluvialis]NKC68569.1 hypothetical protein [Vagococcus fluvialis]